MYFYVVVFKSREGETRAFVLSCAIFHNHIITVPDALWFFLCVDLNYWLALSS